MAAAATKKQPAAAAATGEPAVVDPKFEWAEKAGSYVLRLALPGFRKDGFRVQVDGAGRLTVRGARPGTGAAAGQGSLNKVFQLPASASLDDISGRFEAGVLTLTVPKRASSAPAPTSIEEIKRKPSMAKEEGATADVKKGDAGAKKTEAKEDMAKKHEDALKNKAMQEASNKAQEKKQEEEEEAKSRKQDQQKPAPGPAKKEEAVMPKPPQAAATAPPPEKPAPKPEGATSSEKAKAAVAPDNLAERVRRHGEEERAKAAAMKGEEERAKAATMKAISKPEKKATAPWAGGWKERVQGELKVLTDMKWADRVVEAARKNKEVVAVGIAAFSLGFLVSQKLFRK